METLRYCHYYHHILCLTAFISRGRTASHKKDNWKSACNKYNHSTVSKWYRYQTYGINVSTDEVASFRLQQQILAAERNNLWQLGAAR